MANFGYKRVSSLQQVTDRQLVDIELDEVFEDKITGSTMNRPRLKALLATVRKDDVIFVHSIDRLGRNLCDILNLINELDAKGVAVVAVSDGIDTRKNDAASMAFLQLRGTFAEYERKVMLTRQREAMEVAKANGTWKPRGKGKAVNHDGIEHALKSGESIRKVAKIYDVNPSTVQRIKAALEAAEAL